MTAALMEISLSGDRHYKKAFSADEAIFVARLISLKDCFVVPPRNDDFFRGSVNGSEVEGPKTTYKHI